MRRLQDVRDIREDRQPAPQKRPTPIQRTQPYAEPHASALPFADSRIDKIIHLQQTIGNRAVQRLMVQNRLSGIVARRCACEDAPARSMPGLQRDEDGEDDGDSSSQDVIGEDVLGATGDTSDESLLAGDDTATAGGASAESLLAGNDTAAADGPLADDALANLANAGGLGLLSDALVGCTPAPSAFTAKAMHFSVRQTWLPFSSGAFGPQTTSVWEDYLNSSLPLPRPTRSFAGSGEIVTGFSQHHKSIEAEKEIVATAGKALKGSALLPAPGTAKSLPLTSAVPAATLTTRINDKSDPMGLTYDNPATTIPGNLAGGIGSGGKPGNTVGTDPDTRAVDGNLQLSVDNTGTNLTITPQLTFNVHDTVDFCPGNLGSIIARAETVPMSILEATEARFGPVFAADVPFNVSYPGAGTAQTVLAK